MTAIDSFDSEFAVKFLFIAAAVIIVPLVMFGPLSCPNERQASDVLHAEGYTRVKMTGGAGTSSCGRDDNSATGFEATTSAGHRVKGVVCCGLAFKACTVRVSKVLE